MSKVAITGTTSHHSSSQVNERSLSFPGAIRSILKFHGHDVDFVDPKVQMTKKHFKEYDSIIVGVSPPLSVTANKAYGALSVINLLGGDDRLRFFVDTPNVWSITANVRAIKKDFSAITKSFYSKRLGYKELMSDEKVRKNVQGGVDFLFSSEWPVTLYPAMPWSSDSEVLDSVSSVEKVVGVHVDSHYVRHEIPDINAQKQKRWAADTAKSKWAVSTTSSLRFPHVTMRQSKVANDSDVAEVIARSIGALISPLEDGRIWWNFRWAQAMNSSTPIASDWRTTSKIGSSWSHLAAGIEELSHIDMYELSVSQKAEYIDSTPSQDTVRKLLEGALGI